MPLKRTPPASAQLSSSEQSDTHELETEYCATPNIPFRMKRKRSPDLHMEIQNFMADMKSMFTEFRERQEDKFNKLYSTMAEIVTQNTEFRASMDFLSQSYDTLKTKIQNMEAEHKQCVQQLQSIETKLEQFERQSRSTCIEIRNVPQMPQEHKDSLLKTVTTLFKKVNVSLEPYDLKDVFRISTRAQDYKTIIVDCRSVPVKDRILRMFKKYTKENQQLKTDCLNSNEPARPIYMSENLTPKMKRLFFLTRDFAKSNGFRFCWVSNGKIFLRKREGEKLSRINDESDFIKLKEQV